jgi:hypothetical protein
MLRYASTEKTTRTGEHCSRSVFPLSDRGSVLEMVQPGDGNEHLKAVSGRAESYRERPLIWSERGL